MSIMLYGAAFIGLYADRGLQQQMGNRWQHQL